MPPVVVTVTSTELLELEARQLLFECERRSGQAHGSHEEAFPVAAAGFGARNVIGLIPRQPVGDQAEGRR